MNASGSDNHHNETPKSKRRSYSVTQKIEVIEFAKVLTHKEACSRFNVDPKSLRRWMSMENFLRDMGRSPVLSQLTRIVGRDVQWARIEDELYAWVQVRSENGQKILLTEVAAEAENILRRHPDCNETFKADSRYVSKFLSRHNIQYDKDTRKRQFKNDSGDDAAFDAVVNNTRGRRPVKQRRASESDSKSLREAAKIAKRNICGNVPKLRNVKLEFAPSSTSLLQSLESNMKEIDKKFQSPNATPRRPLRSKTIARVSVVKNVGIKKEFIQPQYFEDFFDDDDDEVSSVSSDDASYTPTGKARYELRSRPTEYEFRRSSRKRTTRSTAATAVKQTPVKKPRAKSQNKAASSSKSKKQTSQAKKATAKSKTVKQESKCLDAPTTSRERQKDEEDTQNAEIMHQELQSLLEVARATRSQNPDQGSSSSEAGSIHGQDIEKKIKVARILSLESQAGISHKPVTAEQAGETHVKDSKLDVVDDDEKTQNDKIMQREWQSLLDPAAPTKGHKSYGLESSSSEIDQSDDHSRSVVFDEEVLPNTHVLPRESLPKQGEEQVATSQDLEWSSSDDDLIDEENPRDAFVEKNPPNKTVFSVKYEPVLDSGNAKKHHKQGPTSSGTAIADCDTGVISEESRIQKASPLERQSAFALQSDTTMQGQESSLTKTPQTTDNNGTQKKCKLEFEPVMTIQKPWSPKMMPTFGLEPVMSIQNNVCSSRVNDPFDDENVDDFNKKNTALISTNHGQVFDLQTAPETEDHGSLSPETAAMDDQDQTAIAEEEAVCNAPSVEPQLTLNADTVTADQDQDARIRFSPTSNSSFSDEIDVINIFDDEEEVTSNGTSLTDESKAKFDLKVMPSAHIQKPPAIRTETVEIDVVTIDDLDDPEDVGQTENGKAVSKESHSVLNDSEYSVTGLHDNREDEVFVIIDDFPEGYPVEQNLDIKPTEEELHSSQNSTIPTANQNFQQGSYLASLLGETDEGIDQNSGAAGLEFGRKRRSWSVETEPLFLEESRSSLERTFATSNQEPSQSFNALNDNTKGNKGQPQDNSECEYQTKAKNSRKRKQSGPSQTPNKQASKRGQSLCKIAKTKNEEQPHSLGEGEDRKKNNNSRKRKPNVANERQKADIKRAKSLMPRQLPFF